VIVSPRLAVWILCQRKDDRQAIRQWSKPSAFAQRMTIVGAAAELASWP
jgi:hypothetical protein